MLRARPRPDMSREHAPASFAPGIERERYMSPEWLGSHYCAVYSLAESAGEPSRAVTPVRGSVEAVLADLLRLRRGRPGFRHALLIDLATLEPIEPMETTLARLGRPG
jgi:hypothetical protein